jgi:hypothetical protein
LCRRARFRTGARQCGPLQTLSRPACGRSFGQPRGTCVTTPRSTFLVSCRPQDPGEPFASSKCLPSKKPLTSTLTGAHPGDPHPLADGWGSARFHQCSKTLTRPFSTSLFAGASRPHALPRLLQRMFQRARPGTARTSQMHRTCDSGTIACSIDRYLSIEGQPPRLRRVRGRGSPNLDIPFRDYSQKRLRPNPDRLRRLVSRGSLFNPVWSDVDQERARQRYPACKARTARGP